MSRKNSRVASEDELAMDGEVIASDPIDGSGRDWRALTINGAPVPEQCWPHNRYGLPGMDYRHTDQGITEANVGKSPIKVSVGAGPRENAIAARRDFRMYEDEPQYAPDPLRELSDRYARPGFESRYLSSSRVDKEGGNRRGYEIVTDNGQPVRFGALILGQIPVTVAERRRQQIQARTDRALTQIHEAATAAGARPEADLTRTGQGVRQGRVESPAF